MEFAELSIKNLFPTPLVIAALPEAEAASLNGALVEMIMQRSAASDGVKISNQGGWQSDDQILQWGGAPVATILQRIQSLLEQITLYQRKDGFERTSIPWRINAWANINRSGHSNVPHYHPGAFWSAVYYVQVDEDPENKMLGGELELIDPRGVTPLMYCPVLKFGIKGYVSAGTSELHRPRAGQIVVFPSWLQHAVAPYRGDGTRISIAFNFSV